MLFTEMRDMLIKHFDEVMRDQNYLFEVDVNKDEMWNTYLSSFPNGTNNIYRTRTEHDCSCCRGFIKNIGAVVAIIGSEMVSIWDFEIDDETYGPVIKAMSEFVHRHVVRDVFLSSFSKIGCHHNFEILEKLGQHRYDHFFIDLAGKHVIRSDEKNTKLNELRTSKEVFKRALDEISIDAIDTVLELIADNSIYRGNEWKTALERFWWCRKEYDNFDLRHKDLYAWYTSTKLANTSVVRIKNNSIGVLLMDISNGRDLEDAVRNYEAITDPTVYKHPKPIFTERMRKDAEKKVMELGFMDSLPRRFANLDDITVNDILFTDRSAANRINGAESIFDALAKDVTTKPKKFDRVETVSIDKFIEDIVPTATRIEAYVENKHSGNFVSLIAPVNKDSKSMFKWGNNFSWAYAGNVTDSFKDKVKSFGGNVDGVLRFSIKWNESQDDSYDLDAHACTPNNFEIFFGCKEDPKTGGKLDVDIIDPRSDVRGDDKTAVENITWSTKSRMTPGLYHFYVQQYSGSVMHGFRAEIEMDGEIYSFDYPHSMRAKENVAVADVLLDESGNFSIIPAIDNTKVVSKTKWSIDTNKFVPVTSIMYSPNHWSTAEKNVGHQHVFFMLDGCRNDENPSGIFNEYLVQELNENRRVMQAISNKMRVADTDDQLSGLGFATDKRAELVVKVIGASERVLKIQF